MPPPFWLHLWGEETHELEKQISKSVATTPLTPKKKKKSSQMNLSSTARKQDTDCLPPPGTHTGTRRQQQRIFSQTPGTPAVRVSGSSPENHGAKPTTPSCRQISVFRAEFSKPVFKTETYSFLASGESQLIHKEERKAEVPLRRRWFWSAGQLMSFVRAHQYLLSAVFYCIPIL